jgi:hypothetical protein
MDAQPRVFADFNDLLATGDRLWLDTVGAREDLDRQGLTLHEDLALTLYDHDLDDAGRKMVLLADGKVVRDAPSGRWSAIIDTATIRHGEFR